MPRLLWIAIMAIAVGELGLAAWLRYVTRRQNQMGTQVDDLIQAEQEEEAAIQDLKGRVGGMSGRIDDLAQQLAAAQAAGTPPDLTAAIQTLWDHKAELDAIAGPAAA